jgi:iron(III) transport system substrate-binding protein
MIRSTLAGAAALLGVLSFAVQPKAQAITELTVYGSIEPDEVKPWTDRFHQDNPNIRLKIIRNSTGALTAKLMAEKDRPQADVIWRLANTSLIALEKQGQLLAYEPKGYAQIDPRFRDKATPPSWVGIMAYEGAICFNEALGKKLNLPKPTTWMDLVKPVYRDKIVMPNPSSSGTGFMAVSAWLQVFGEEKAWTFMQELNNNMALYTHSGSKPCSLAATGEYPIGISWAFRAASLKSKGAPIDIIFPKEGLGWDLEGAAIVKGTQHVAAAKTFMDWAISPAAMELYSKSYPTIAVPSMAKAVEHFPPNMKDLIIKNDFWWAADNRDRVLDIWQRRFESKTEPR